MCHIIQTTAELKFSHLTRARKNLARFYLAKFSLAFAHFRSHLQVYQVHQPRFDLLWEMEMSDRRAKILRQVACRLQALMTISIRMHVSYIYIYIYIYIYMSSVHGNCLHQQTGTRYTELFIQSQQQIDKKNQVTNRVFHNCL